MGLMAEDHKRTANPDNGPARTDTELALARAVLQVADDGGMPDTYWRTDSRVKLARDVLGVPAGGRYTHEHLWDGEP